MKMERIWELTIALLIGMIVGAVLTIATHQIDDCTEILEQERLLGEQYESDCYEIGGVYRFGECVHTLIWDTED